MNIRRSIGVILRCIGKYVLNIMISIDQLCNAILFGNVDHTISGRVGYNALLGSFWALYAQELINLLFFFDKDHCYTSIEWDEVPLSKEDFT